ncbi:unnamed protein product [Fusarium equiseti]|uniref:Uncharacterized protein n=1 Tax=Fusarium equiseti TaxID=61235 RepID=A0A8J2ITF7_FUSEQ|nr:unnamed protein product [Fusarium equiseti]
MPKATGAQLRVIRDADFLPRLIRWGPGEFTDLTTSAHGSKSPIVCGIWNADDVEDGTESFVAECNLSNKKSAGESIWKDVASGKTFRADAGSVIWFAKGSESILVYSKGLSTFYVESTPRETTRINLSSEELRQRIAKLEAINELEIKNAVQPSHNGGDASFSQESPGLEVVSISGHQVTCQNGKTYVNLVPHDKIEQPLSIDMVKAVNSLGDRLRDGINEANQFMASGEPLLTATGQGREVIINFGGPSPDGLRRVFSNHMIVSGFSIGRQDVLEAVRLLLESLLTIEIAEE